MLEQPGARIDISKEYKVLPIMLVVFLFCISVINLVILFVPYPIQIFQ